MRVGVRRRWIVLTVAIALCATPLERGASGAGQATPDRSVDSCVSCHSSLVQRYVKTAHFLTSAPATPTAILDHVPAHVSTAIPTTRFRVEARANGVYQIATWMAADRVRSRTERIDLVVGSGRRGQSYLYWKDGLLYQLPLSYLVTESRWVNSPGYVDGEVHFDRVIPPRCLECHATSFRVEGVPPHVKYASEYELGLGCRVCHGRGLQRSPVGADAHPVAGIVNPARLTRHQQIDVCAVCHAGADREPRRPPFTFTPGDRLEDHLGPLQDDGASEPDVHGSQVALLAASRCFQASPAMTCSTCHDVHRTERNTADLSSRCTRCHALSADASNRGAAGVLPAGHAALTATTATCVDCHMPLRPSRLIRIAEGRRTVAPLYRTHRIAIYPPSADAATRELRR